MVRQRHGDKLQEFLPHSTLSIGGHSRDGSRLMGGPGIRPSGGQSKKFPVLFSVFANFWLVFMRPVKRISDDPYIELRSTKVWKGGRLLSLLTEASGGISPVQDRHFNKTSSRLSFVAIAQFDGGYWGKIVLKGC